MQELLPSYPLGRYLLNLALCLIALLCSVNVNFKDEFKKQKLYWVGFWINLILMFSYYSIFIYTKGIVNEQCISADNQPYPLFHIVQSIASLIGHTSLALIYFDLGINKHKNDIFVTSIILATCITIMILFFDPRLGYVLLALIYGTLFIMIGYRFRLLDIDTSLVFIAYGFYSFVYLLEKVFLNQENIRETTPLILLLAHLAFIRGIYKLVVDRNMGKVA